MSARSEGSYALEHTGIEPFPNQIKMQVDNEKLFAPVMARFKKQIRERSIGNSVSPWMRRSG